MEKDRVFFWSILCFILGIGFGSFFHPIEKTFVFLSGAFVVTLFCAFPKRNILLVGVFLSLFYFGASHSTQAHKDIEAWQEFEKDTEGVVRVLFPPEEKSFYQKVILRFESCKENACPPGDILWQAEKSQRLSVGERRHFRCTLHRPENFDPEFDYRMFLAKDHIGYTCEKALLGETLPKDLRGTLFTLLYAPKSSFEYALSRSIPEPEAGLAKGLLLGGDEYLPDALKESFSRIGLSHMIAVSGYNITLIAQGFLIIGLFFGLWRKHAIWTAFIGIILFIAMIGAPSSAVRAGAMAGVVFAALQAGRLARPTNALLLAGGLMLLFNPLLLRYDLGFQLSFLATLGIVVSLPYMERYLPTNIVWKSILEILFMTLAVELFVLPIILLTFHTFSLLVVVGNLLILLVPMAMGLSFLGAILYLFVPGAHIIFSWAAFLLLTLITRVVEWLGSLSHMSVQVSSFGIQALVVWYILLMVIVILGERYSSKKIYAK